MKIAGPIFAGFVLSMSAGAAAQTYPCLPADITRETVVSYPAAAAGRSTAAPVTVGKILKRLRARCVRGRLVDGKLKPIRFYDLEGCWGNPPSDYLEIIDRQKKAIAELRRTNTVVEITCMQRL